jgi:long-chain fatty acid transport protein
VTLRQIGQRRENLFSFISTPREDVALGMREEIFVRHAITAGLMALAATPAFAGGIERSNQSMAILFQQGRYVEFGASYAQPNVQGNVVLPPAPGASGNITRSFMSGAFSYKADINDKLSYAIILDQPFGADTLYPVGTTLGNSAGKITNTMLTGVMRYKFGNGFSAYAGLRSSWTKGSVFLSIVPGGYAMTAPTDQATGYLVGVAYEKPEIALRVALTYSSKIKHTFNHTVNAAPAGTFSTNIPQSVNLEFQSGVAADTLVFGSIRWVDWTDFNISPAGAPNLVSYDKDSITYTLGVGRKFSDSLSGSVSISHDTGNGPLTSNLGPIGKRTSLGVGLSYTKDAMTISGGIQYTKLGGVTTRAPVSSVFGSNKAIGVGVRVGYRF